MTKERDSYLSELVHLREQYRQKVWTQKEEEFGWSADPEEVIKAETELSSEIDGDRYSSRISNAGLKEILLDLYRYPGKYVEAIRKVIDTYDMVHGQSR